MQLFGLTIILCLATTFTIAFWGIDKVKAEWAMICIAHNLRKLTLVVA